MSPEPTQIGSYEIVKTLGKGGMGSVYLARDSAIDRLVAIKLLREGLDSPELRERFTREARSAGRLRHPNIVTIFQAGEHNKQPFIVMEYIPGKSLAETIREQVAISVPAKIKIIEEVCSGLAYAHKSGIVHRDIKPPNIVLDSDGSAKILDFGIARIAEVADQGLTRVGTRLGTPNYMSPEQISAGTADLRSDIFAVGLVMYELLTYSRAFSGEMMEVLQNILSREPEPIEKFCPRIDPEIAAIVRKAIQKRPEDRYQDLAVMRREMERIRARMDDQLEDGGGAAATAAMPTPVPSVIPAIPVIPVISAAESARPDDATLITPRPVFPVFEEAATLAQPVPVAIPVNMPAPSVPAPSVPAPSVFMPPPGPRPQVAAPVGPAPKAQAVKSKPINPLLWLAPVAAAVVLGVIWFAFLRPSPAQIASSEPAPTTVAAADPPAAAPVAPAPAVPVEAAPAPPPAPLAAINGRLTVRSTPTGATVQVDGKNIGTTTLTLGNLARGAHTVRVTLDGYVTQQRQVTISDARQTAALTLTLAPVAVAAAPVQPAAPIEPPPVEVAKVEAPPPPAPVDPDTAAIQSVLNQYVAGYEALDPAAIKRAWPNAGNLTLNRIASYQLSLANVTITVRGTTATVECVRQIRYQPTGGQMQDLNAKTIFTLRRTNGNWLIDRIQ